MDKSNEIIEKIVLIKIITDSTEYFDENELNEYCRQFSISRKVLNSLLDIEPSLRKKELFYSKTYKEYKKSYLIYNQNNFIREVIKYNIKKNYSYLFNLDLINELSQILKINPYDLVKYILKSNKYLSLIRGDYNSFVSDYYNDEKEKYLISIRHEIIEQMIEDRIPSNHTKSFNFNEINEYSKKYNINIRDFLVCILMINKYIEKKYNEHSTFSSNYYKTKKEEYLLKKKNDILNNILSKRIKYISSYSFTVEEIQALSEKHKINIRDFIVYILGKSDQLYHDFKGKRVGNIYSYDYFKLKQEYVLKKREEISYMFNINRRTYFTLEDISFISSIIGINKDDIILNFFGKTKKNLYNLKTNYRNRKRISYGEYKSTSLPKMYLEKNYYQIKDIVEVAVKSAFNFLGTNYYESINIFDDLVQEGLIYLIQNGNPWQASSYMLAEEDIEYNEDHGKILYTKCFYYTLTNIKKTIQNKVSTGTLYDIKMKTNGIYDSVSNIELQSFIDKITEDEVTKKILIYFSKNTFSENSILKLENIMGLDKDDILFRLKSVRNDAEKILVQKKR